MASADVEPISGSPAFTGGASQQQARQQQTGHHDQQQTVTTLQGPAVIPPTPGPNLNSEPLPTQPTVVTSSNRTIIHGLIGSGTIQETVKNSLSSLTGVKTNNSKQKEPEKYGQQNEVLIVCSHKAGEIRDAPAEEDQPPKQTSLLLTKLSPEILQAIIRHCRFSDIVNLRKTCRTLHILAGPDELRILHGREQFRQLLYCHCKICLLHNEDRKKLLRSDSWDVGWPLSNTCIDCALKAGDSRVRVGRKVNLASKDQVWVCRWCGRPVAERPAAGSEQFHRLCYRSYHRALAAFFGLGWIQFCLGIVAGALAWRYFRWERLVFGPTVTNFLLLWIDLIFLTFRGNDRNTYPITFGLELIILGLWIAPMYHVATLIHENLGLNIPTENSTWASMVIFGLNMFFRLMNVIGNFILLYRPDLTRRRRPAVVLWKKGLYKIACMFVFFTYPQSVEAKVRDAELRR